MTTHSGMVCATYKNGDDWGIVWGDPTAERIAQVPLGQGMEVWKFIRLSLEYHGGILSGKDPDDFPMKFQWTQALNTQFKFERYQEILPKFSRMVLIKLAVWLKKRERHHSQHQGSSWRSPRVHLCTARWGWSLRRSTWVLIVNLKIMTGDDQHQWYLRNIGVEHPWLPIADTYILQLLQLITDWDARFWSIWVKEGSTRVPLFMERPFNMDENYDGLCWLKSSISESSERQRDMREYQ